MSTVNGDLDNWVMKNLKNGNIAFDRVPVHLFFACAVWFIWKWTCKKVLKVDFVVPQNFFQCINRFCCDWVNANLVLAIKDYFLISIAWTPPSVGWVKLNVDGSCNPNSGTISVGGVLRDHLKNWLKGFALNRGVGSILEAEL